VLVFFVNLEGFHGLFPVSSTLSRLLLTAHSSPGCPIIIFPSPFIPLRLPHILRGSTHWSLSVAFAKAFLPHPEYRPGFGGYTAYTANCYFRIT
jgi:hypothetical protein